MGRRAGIGARGDSRFDYYFQLKNLSNVSAGLLRDPAVQEALYEARDFYDDISLRDSWVQAGVNRVVSKPEELEKFIEPAATLATALKDASLEPR